MTRVGALLRGVSVFEPAGGSTSAIARHVDMSRPTTHRLLTSLAGQGLLDRDRLTGRWHLGPETYLLGAVASDRYDVSQHARAIVHELAEETEESAFFSVRRGDETVCLLRQDGSFPLRSHVLHEGIRLPLGVASAGLAILSHLPEPEADDVVRSHDLVPRFGADHCAEALSDRIRQTRSNGYATNPGLLVEGSWGMGAAVFDANGLPAWALSLTGVESRFRPDRQPALGRLLLKKAHQLTEQLKGTDRR